MNSKNYLGWLLVFCAVVLAIQAAWYGIFTYNRMGNLAILISESMFILGALLTRFAKSHSSAQSFGETHAGQYYAGEMLLSGEDGLSVSSPSNRKRLDTSSPYADLERVRGDSKVSGSSLLYRQREFKARDE